MKNADAKQFDPLFKYSLGQSVLVRGPRHQWSKAEKFFLPGVYSIVHRHLRMTRTGRECKRAKRNGEGDESGVLLQM